MASNNIPEDYNNLSYDEWWNERISQAWNFSRTRVLQRSGKTRQSILDLLHELHDAMAFLRKAFVGREEDLPIMEASIKSMVASVSQEYGSFQLKVELVNKLAPSMSTPVGDLAAPDPSRGALLQDDSSSTTNPYYCQGKRTRENEDRVTPPEKRQKPELSGYSTQADAEVADRAREQWQTRIPDDSAQQWSRVYIMSDVTPMISRAEVEAQHWVFQYPAHGNGYYIIRCHWGSCSKSKAFTRHPFESGQAMRHFNDPRNNHGKERFSEAEIMKAFALEVQDASDEWVIPSNITLSQPSPASTTSQAMTSRKSKTKALAGRSATKAASRKPSIRDVNTGPYIFPDIDDNFTSATTQSDIPIDLESGNPCAYEPQTEDTFLPEIMVRTGDMS